jgi:hypothetical protein
MARTQPTASARLDQAREWAEKALALKQTLDLSAQPWPTQDILAQIAELQGQAAEARHFRRQARQSFAAFAGNRHAIDRTWSALITDIAAARDDGQLQATVRAQLPELEASGWHITTAVEQIWAGERDWPSLTDDLDPNSALVILRVLETIAEA